MALLVTDKGETAGKATSFAKTQLGKPYKWGAVGPDSYDCSGLIMASFKAAGVIPNHRWTTMTLMNMGDPVANIEAAGVGDLIFPDVGHVGFYMGGKQMVHAPDVGDVVKWSPVPGRIHTIRRLVTPTGIVVGGEDAIDTQIGGELLEPLRAIGSFLNGFVKLITWPLNPHNWFRVALFIMGSIALIVAIVMWFNLVPPVGKIAKLAGNIAGPGKFTKVTKAVTK